MKNKYYSVVNGSCLIFTVLVNYLSNTGILNGSTMKTVSNEYFTRFTPAGYAFSIWGIIYLGLASFVVYTARGVFKDTYPFDAVKKIGWWFAISCFANMLWVVAWLYDYIVLSVVLMSILLTALLTIVRKLQLSTQKISLKNYFFVALPFSLYAGWISLAIIANIASLLTMLRWDGFGLTAQTWAIMMVTIAGMLNVYMVLKRNMRAYGTVGIWGLLAIAANQETDGYDVRYACYAMSVLVLLAIVLNYFRPKLYR